MTSTFPPLNRELLLGYFNEGASPRDRWKVGMEVEKMALDRATGNRLPYDAEGPCIRRVLESLRAIRGGAPVYEAGNVIGVDAAWGTLSLEPGGQVEWSSKPASDLSSLRTDLTEHLAAMSEAASALGVDWLDVAVDPERPVDEMPWMPKARYKIMRGFLGERGRLAHRMMTQTASIQCAYDYADADDWAKKFRAAALLAPVATALFANSRRVDGRESGYVSYREAIWRETDPARCGLPSLVFEPGFTMERWLDWVLDVPTIFRHRARGLAAAGAVPFRELMTIAGCDAVRHEDWETHVSTIFTEVRSYNYIEVRSADLQSDDRAFAVPTFWTGMLYDDEALDWAETRLGHIDHAEWLRGMGSAGRSGMAGSYAGFRIAELAAEALATAVRSLRGAPPCVDDPAAAVDDMDALAAHTGLDIRT